MYAEARLPPGHPHYDVRHTSSVYFCAFGSHPEHGDRQDAGHRGEVMGRQARVLGVGLDLRVHAPGR